MLFTAIKQNYRKIGFVLLALVTIAIFFGILSFVTPLAAHAQGAPCTTDDGRPGTFQYPFGLAKCVANDAGYFEGQLGSIKEAASDVASPIIGDGACSVKNLIGYGGTLCLISIVLHTIGGLFGFLIMLAMIILEYALYLNSKILLLPAVQLGWTFVRDMANMGFVLGIIVIAFATILRSQTYGVKQLIVKLIVAAVAVNLSLSLAGVFLDLANIPTQFFIDKISGAAGGPGEFSTVLASAFQIQNINQINESIGAEKLHFGGAALVALSSILFSLIFSFVILVTLIAMVVMFLARFAAIAIFIIVMPMAILFWVFPTVRGMWGQWSQAFIKWTFFAPVSLFFLYLAIYTVKAQGAYITQAANVLKASPLGGAAALNSNITIATNDPILLVANMVMMTLLSLGGLFAANKLSIYGASYAYGFATSGATRILRAGTVTPAAALGRMAMTHGGGVDAEGKAKSSYAQRVANGLASIPYAGRLFAGASERIGKTVRDVQKDVEGRRKSFDDGDKEYRMATLNRMTSAADPIAASALLLSMAKKGELRDLDEAGNKRLNGLLAKLAETNNSKEFMHYMPEYSKAFGKEIREVLPGAPVEAYEAMKSGIFKSDHEEKTEEDKKRNEVARDAVLFSSSAGLRRIAERGDPATIYEIMRTFDKLKDKYASFDATAERKLIEAGSVSGASDEAIKQGGEARTRLQNYQRYQSQRNFFYQDSIYQGFANQPDIEKFREERRATRRGKSEKASGKESESKLVDQYGRKIT